MHRIVFGGVFGGGVFGTWVVRVNACAFFEVEPQCKCGGGTGCVSKMYQECGCAVSKCV